MFVLRTNIVDYMANEHTRPFQERKRMTRLGEALAIRLAQLELPILSDYQIFRELWLIYERGQAKYLRSAYPPREQYQRTRTLLQAENIIAPDPDYAKLWR